MSIELTSEAKAFLEKEHKKERDKRICDRIKAVLLKSERWILEEIAQALRIHEETVRTHWDDDRREQKLKPENGDQRAC